jgi:hypothetical protein
MNHQNISEHTDNDENECECLFKRRKEGQKGKMLKMQLEKKEKEILISPGHNAPVPSLSGSHCIVSGPLRPQAQHCP